MEKASNLLVKFSKKLFSDAEQQDQFVAALTQPGSFHPCILWTKPRRGNLPFAIEPSIPWQPHFIDRLAFGERPGQHPLHNEGYFYCLDFSSVFAATPLLTIDQPVRLVADICGSPGGKSLFAWVALKPEFLLSNEVIGKRIGALLSNLKRCEAKPSVITNLDSSILAEEISGTADVVLVDAPCSGQSLLAKGGKSPGCFHPVNINKNANRQKRIIANSGSIVSPQGYLLYMTCAYSLEENEQVCEWFLERFPHFKPIDVPALNSYRSHLTSLPCYRMFPQTNLGAGAFTALFQNTEAHSDNMDSIQQKFNLFLQRPRLIFV